MSRFALWLLAFGVTLALFTSVTAQEEESDDDSDDDGNFQEQFWNL